MNTPFNTHRSLALLLTLLLTTAACDSGGDNQAPFSEVAGTYAFAEFVFAPTTQALQDVNMLDTLMTANTRLRLFEDGQYTLAYQFQGGPESVASGNFSVDTRRIKLTSDRSDEDRLKSMLLDKEVTLDRPASGGNTLTAAIARTINLQAFSSKYAGLTAIPGTLTLRLTRQ